MDDQARAFEALHMLYNSRTADEEAWATTKHDPPRVQVLLYLSVPRDLITRLSPRGLSRVVLLSVPKPHYASK